MASISAPCSSAWRKPWASWVRLIDSFCSASRSFGVRATARA